MPNLPSVKTITNLPDLAENRWYYQDQILLVQKIYKVLRAFTKESLKAASIRVNVFPKAARVDIDNLSSISSHSLRKPAGLAFAVYEYSL
jgi:hypothetical protein